jgi:N-formylglutamate deformylase
MTDACTLHLGSTPLLVSLPHVGTVIPADQRHRYVERALALEDTDWHLALLYDFVRELGASLIVPLHSRYLIDLNRPPENAPMYAGVNNTELCPTRFFSGDALYRDGMAPDEAEIERRRSRYWRPYHQALQDELQRLRAAHGHALLFDGHSIRSELPWLFEGRLPDLNLGSVGGTSCASTLRSALAGVLQAQTRFTQVVDGRFKGGYITRQYGRPQQGVHAVQLEMCWRCYMPEEAPYRLDPQRVDAITPLLRELAATLLAWRPDAA